MADIDFLYVESQHERVKAALLENGFSGYKEGRKNDTYYRKPYVSVEAHRQLVPSDSSFYPYCSHVWERAHLAAGLTLGWKLPNGIVILAVTTDEILVRAVPLQNEYMIHETIQEMAVTAISMNNH